MGPLIPRGERSEKCQKIVRTAFTNICNQWGDNWFTELEHGLKLDCNTTNAGNVLNLPRDLLRALVTLSKDKTLEDARALLAAQARTRYPNSPQTTPVLTRTDVTNVLDGFNSPSAHTAPTDIDLTDDNDSDAPIPRRGRQPHRGVGFNVAREMRGQSGPDEEPERDLDLEELQDRKELRKLEIEELEDEEKRREIRLEELDCRAKRRRIKKAEIKDRAIERRLSRTRGNRSNVRPEL